MSKKWKNVPILVSLWDRINVLVEAEKYVSVASFVDQAVRRKLIVEKPRPERVEEQAMEVSS